MKVGLFIPCYIDQFYPLVIGTQGARSSTIYIQPSKSNSLRANS